MKHRLPLSGFAVACALIALACGGGGPTTPSGSGGVVIQGVVMDGASSLAASSGSHAGAKAQKVTVRVDGTGLVAEVAANGTFEVKGVPAGTFTIVFLVDGVEVGRVPVTAPDGSEVRLVVRVESSRLVVVELRVEGNGPSSGGTAASCILNGGTVGQGLELEGHVGSGTSAAFTLAVNGRSSELVNVTAGTAAYTCVGNAKTTGDCKASLKAGAKVHVSGTLTSCSVSEAHVTATQVKIQKD